MIKEKNMKNKFLVGFAATLCAAVLTGGVATLRTTANADTSGADEISHTFSYNTALGDNDWVTQPIDIDSAFYTTANEVQVADLSQVKAMTFTVDNTDRGGFTWNMGIWDSLNSVFDNQWYMGGTGSALYVPESGTAFWENSAVIPAGFHGTVVLPFTAMLFDGSDYVPKYSDHNNPVFKMRISAGATGRYDTANQLQSFPTATMQRQIYFYTINNWAQGGDVTFHNIQWITDSAVYEGYLQKCSFGETAVTAIAEEVNNVDTDGAVVFKSEARNAMTLKMQAYGDGGFSVTALNGVKGFAVRLRNYRNSDLSLEWVLHEASSEQLFMFANSRNTPVTLVAKDGTVTQVNAQGHLTLPAYFDGTAIIPISGLALYLNPNGPEYLNGRVDGFVWQTFFYTQSEVSEFCVAEIYQIYEGESGYSLSAMKTASGGGDVNYAKTINSWVVPEGVTKTKVSGSKTVTVSETVNGNPVESGAVTATASKSALQYGDACTITVPDVSGKSLTSATVNGEVCTSDFVRGENCYVYTYRNTERGAGTLAVTLEYAVGYNVEYVLGGGSFVTDDYPTIYMPTDTGDNALVLPVPMKANNAFIGWFTGTQENAVKIEKLDYEALGELGLNQGTLTLYARWKDDYTVTVTEVGGTKSETLTLKMGEAVTEEMLAEVLTVAGKTYAVYTDESCTQVIELPYSGTELAASLYVKYTDITLTVRFHTMGGGSITDRKVTYQSALGELPVPEREGHTFKGWYFGDDYENVALAESVIDTDCTLYAKWEKLPEEKPAKGGCSSAASTGLYGVGAVALMAALAIVIAKKKKTN